MVMNGVDENTLNKHMSMTMSSKHKVALSHEFTLMRKAAEGIENEEKTQNNVFVTEMAMKNIKDFKQRSRTNIVPRVAKRLDVEERRTKDQ